jgi:hypothetical protein
MKVVGFNFDKISVEKLKERTDKLKVTTQIDVSEIKQLKPGFLKTKEDLLKVKFYYGVKYEPGFALVDLKGTVILSLSEKRSKEVLKEWKKKKMPEDFRLVLFNLILKKAALKSLHLEDELNLPLHLPMPTLRPSKEK